MQFLLRSVDTSLTMYQMLVLGSIFQCLGPILTVAAGLSSKPLFVSPLDRREEASRQVTLNDVFFMPHLILPQG